MQIGVVGALSLAVFVGTAIVCAVPGQSPAPPSGRKDAESLAKFARDAMARDDYVAALRLTEQAIPADPGWDALYYNRANIHYYQGHVDAAIADCSHAIRLAQKPNFLYFALRAMAYEDKDDIDHACPDIKAALAISPKDHDMQVSLGSILLKRKDWQEAISVFTRVCTQYPKSYAARLNRGIAYCQSKQFAKGFADFDEAERISPEEIGVPIQRALALYDKGDINASRAACTKVLKRTPNADEKRHYAAVAYTRGLIWGDEGKVAAAMDDFTLAIRLYPKHHLAHLHRGELLFAEREYDKAVADFSVCVKVRPADPAAYEQRAEVYYVLGDREKARQDEATAKSLRKSK